MEEKKLYSNGLKWCRQCNEYLELIQFYHIYKNTHSTLCRNHTNKLRYKNKLIQLIREPNEKKITGFLKLEINIRKSILDDIANKQTLMSISKKYLIPYPTLLSWNKTVQLEIN